MSQELFDPRPVSLVGRHVRLEPLALEHADDLAVAGEDRRIWAHLACEPVVTPAAGRDFIARALRSARDGSEVPFAIVHAASGRVIGSTRYLAVRRAHRGLEIGWTWLSAAHWRTPVNTECKLLLMTHAFESLGAVRVEFKTDARNERSQAALTRIGAVREGTLRSHMLMPDGYRRDSVYFSVLEPEWPAVKAGLVAKGARA